MDEMKVIYALLMTDVVLIAIISVFLFILPEKMECALGDEDCLSKLDDMRSMCKNSDTVVTLGNSTSYVKIRVKVYWDGEKCVTEETVVEDYNSGIANYDITGYSTECNVTPEMLEKYGPHACNGSLLGYISPDDTGGDDSGEGGGDDCVYTAYCSLEAEDCKEEATEYVNNCDPAEIVMDMEVAHTMGGTSYWTLSVTIERLPVEYTSTEKLPERCRTTHEVINAVNLPPELPPDIIGKSMTCVIPLSMFPMEDVSIRWCEGDLVEHIQSLYP